MLLYMATRRGVGDVGWMARVWWLVLVRDVGFVHGVGLLMCVGIRDVGLVTWGWWRGLVLDVCLLLCVGTWRGVGDVGLVAWGRWRVLGRDVGMVTWGWWRVLVRGVGLVRYDKRQLSLIETKQELSPEVLRDISCKTGPNCVRHFVSRIITTVSKQLVTLAPVAPHSSDT